LVLTFGALILALGVAEYSTLQRSLLAEVDDNLRRRAAWVADELQAGRIPQGLMVPDGDILDEIAKLFVEIEKDSGQLLAASTNLGSHRLPGSFNRGTYFTTVRTAERHRLRIYQVGLTRPALSIRVAESLELVDRSLQQSILRVVLLGLGATLLAAGSAHRVLRLSLKPLVLVAQVARQIADSGDMSVPVPAHSNVPEVVQVANTLNTLLGRVRHLLEAQQRLLQDTSHELRNPLTVLKMDLEILARPDLDPSMRAEVATEAQAELERLIRLTQDLMLISWAESSPALHLESLRLDTILQEVVERYRPLIQKRSLKTVCPPVWVKADSLRLEQILRNLLDNAIRYTRPEGKITLWLEGAPQQSPIPGPQSPPGQVVLIVQDDGCGIAEEHWESLFERYFRIEPDRNRKAGGVGLGLPLARALARAMGGDLRVYSQPGQGSSFLLQLPLDSDAPAEN
jgi:signal transduction histidine kinase